MKMEKMKLKEITDDTDRIYVIEEGEKYLFVLIEIDGELMVARCLSNE